MAGHQGGELVRVDDVADLLDVPRQRLGGRVGLEPDGPRDGGRQREQHRQVLLVVVGPDGQAPEVGDLEEVRGRRGDVADRDVLLDDGPAEGRPHLEPGPGPLAGLVARVLVGVHLVGLGLDRGDLLVGQPPRQERPLDPHHGDLVGLDGPLGLADVAIGDGLVLEQPLERLLLQAELRERVDVFALLLPQRRAPEDGQELALLDLVAEPERARGGPASGGRGLRVGHRPDLDHLAVEAGVDAREPVRVEGQGSRERKAADLVRRPRLRRPDPERIDHVGRDLQHVVAARDELGRVASGLRRCRGRVYADPFLFAAERLDRPQDPPPDAEREGRWRRGAAACGNGGPFGPPSEIASGMIAKYPTTPLGSSSVPFEAQRTLLAGGPGFEPQAQASDGSASLRPADRSAGPIPPSSRVETHHPQYGVRRGRRSWVRSWAFGPAFRGRFTDRGLAIRFIKPTGALNGGPVDVAAEHVACVSAAPDIIWAESQGTGVYFVGGGRDRRRVRRVGHGGAGPRRPWQDDR
ncbi:hypothetical protein PZE19_26670 [Paludisphaera sp. Pla2]|uniref:Uncharacterized protein n=1 Tax=Paludisphaera mucosa TaxID=3030827 RepID=A0ABT6FIN9_9BACT|nr:hypothetical protein [Paludisphaera mucosa]MDG3007361.1 hypothetical protein [Paludisphaera mucosa]